jgi:hypothetical protein
MEILHSGLNKRQNAISWTGSDPLQTIVGSH